MGRWDIWDMGAGSLKGEAKKVTTGLAIFRGLGIPRVAEPLLDILPSFKLMKDLNNNWYQIERIICKPFLGVTCWSKCNLPTSVPWALTLANSGLKHVDFMFKGLSENPMPLNSLVYQQKSFGEYTVFQEIYFCSRRFVSKTLPCQNVIFNKIWSAKIPAYLDKPIWAVSVIALYFTRRLMGILITHGAGIFTNIYPLNHPNVG